MLMAAASLSPSPGVPLTAQHFSTTEEIQPQRHRGTEAQRHRDTEVARYSLSITANDSSRMKHFSFCSPESLRSARTQGRSSWPLCLCASVAPFPVFPVVKKCLAVAEYGERE